MIRPAHAIAVVMLLLLPGPASAAGVQARFDLSSPTGGPFPSDVFTVPDPDQNTGVRVNLPKPAACPALPPPPAAFAVPTDCFDIDELNTLDGFNLQPRVRLPFTGAIDPASVAGNVFFVSLGDVRGGRGGRRVEVNQVVWDPATSTLFAESDRLLDQHTRYALIVTSGVRDAAGDPVEGGQFRAFRHELNFGRTKSPALKAYRKALLHALDAARVNVAASFAAHGIATIAINVVGHGGGPGGSLVVLPYGAIVPSGGRGIDQNGDGAIDSTEGVNAAFPRTLVGTRDGLRQTVVDLMQLVHVLRTGGVPGVPIDPRRVYYAGQSFGGIYGTIFMALEPSVRVGVLNVPGGPIIDIARISPVFRGLITQGLGARVPPLLNALPITPPLLGFDENLPLRDQPPLVNTVAGAVPIQEVIDNTEWAQQAGSPVAFAPHVVQSPLVRVEPKAVIVQAAKGDMTVPNPTASNVVRAGGLVDRLTYYRNDLAYTADPVFVPRNPHTFLTRVVPLALGGFAPDVVAIALAAQAQIAAFFASDGIVVIDPDGAAGPFFETPISVAERPLLERLNFIP